MDDVDRRVARISSKGQVTIPVDIRRALGVGEGDALVFRNDGGAVTISPVKKRNLNDLLENFDPAMHRHGPDERPWDDAPKGRETI